MTTTAPPAVRRGTDTRQLVRAAGESAQLCEAASKAWAAYAVAVGGMYRTLTEHHGVDPDTARHILGGVRRGLEGTARALMEAASAYDTAIHDLGVLVETVDEARHKIGKRPVGAVQVGV